MGACLRAAPIYSKVWFNTPELCSGSNKVFGVMFRAGRRPRGKATGRQTIRREWICL
jgi:hypothetical protein